MKTLTIITFTLTIFRCDMLVLLAPLTLQMLISNEVTTPSFFFNLFKLYYY
jgi:hypothetical protein